MVRKFFMAYFAFIAWFAVIVGSVGIFMIPNPDSVRQCLRFRVNSHEC